MDFFGQIVQGFVLKDNFSNKIMILLVSEFQEKYVGVIDHTESIGNKKCPRDVILIQYF